MLIPSYVTDPGVRKRIAIEIRVVRKLIRVMKKHGWLVYGVNDGEEFHRNLRTEAKVMDAAFAVDEAAIHFQKKSLTFTGSDGEEYHPAHHVYLVFGNDGWDVICDYTFSERPEDDFDTIMTSEIDPYTNKIGDSL